MLCHCVFPPSVGEFNLLDGSWARKVCVDDFWSKITLVKMVDSTEIKTSQKSRSKVGILGKVWYTPWNQRIEPENRPKPNWKGLSSNHAFPGALWLCEFQGGYTLENEDFEAQTWRLGSGDFPVLFKFCWISWEEKIQQTETQCVGVFTTKVLV